MSDLTPKELQIKAYEVRLEIINMLSAAGSGHSAGPLGAAELFTALYFAIMHHDPKDPAWENRDRLFLSCGHYCPALYATLAQAGYFPLKELLTLRRLGSRLQGHPDKRFLPLLESSSGPLGCGLAQAAGYALAAKLDHENFRTFCLTSDAEHQEGNHWEAVLFAAKYELSNLTCFVDRNLIQISGTTEDILPIASLKSKYESFHWQAIEINGHNIESIIESVELARRTSGRPTVIIAKTTSGKGVSFIENNASWHGRVPTSKEAADATIELKYHLKKLKNA
jgi:transketolase